MSKDVLEGNKRDMSYYYIHQWIQKNYGKACKCENKGCKSVNPKRYEWALIKGMEYDRNIDNFMQMCVSCHRSYDMTEEKKKNMSKTKLNGTNNDKSIYSTDLNGTKTLHRSISEASRNTGVGVQTIYDSLNKKKIRWNSTTPIEKRLTWTLQ